MSEAANQTQHGHGSYALACAVAKKGVALQLLVSCGPPCEGTRCSFHQPRRGSSHMYGDRV